MTQQTKHQREAARRAAARARLPRPRLDPVADVLERQRATVERLEAVWDPPPAAAPEPTAAAVDGLDLAGRALDDVAAELRALDETRRRLVAERDRLVDVLVEAGHPLGEVADRAGLTRRALAKRRESAAGAS